MSLQTAIFSRIYDAILRADRILLVSDATPDGDSIGSTTAMLSWLLREGKSVEAFSIKPIPSYLRFLDNAHAITSDPAVFQKPYQLVMTFDASDPHRCGLTEGLPHIPTKPPVAVFDHHVTNTRFGDLNAIVTDACSTAELVYRFFEEIGARIDDKMATSLLTGITTDTSSFSNAGTTIKGMEAAGALVANGARQSDILRYIIKNQSVPGLKGWGLALSRLHYHPTLDVVTTYFLQEDLQQPGVTEETIEGVSNFLNAVCGGADTILVLKELPNGKIKGSLRSISRDISQVAKLFGGGGHKKAAGFTVDGRIIVENGRVRIVSNQPL